MSKPLNFKPQPYNWHVSWSTCQVTNHCWHTLIHAHNDIIYIKKLWTFEVLISSKYVQAESCRFPSLEEYKMMARLWRIRSCSWNLMLPVGQWPMHCTECPQNATSTELSFLGWFSILSLYIGLSHGHALYQCSIIFGWDPTKRWDALQSAINTLL